MLPDEEVPAAEPTAVAQEVQPEGEPVAEADPVPAADE